MTRKGAEGAAPLWDRLILILLLGTSGGGVVIGGAGQSRVAEQLDRLGKAVESATHELIDQRREHEEFKATTDRRMSEIELRMQQLELTLRKGAFKQ